MRGRGRRAGRRGRVRGGGGPAGLRAKGRRPVGGDVTSTGLSGSLRMQRTSPHPKRSIIHFCATVIRIASKSPAAAPGGPAMAAPIKAPATILMIGTSIIPPRMTAAIVSSSIGFPLLTQR